MPSMFVGCACLYPKLDRMEYGTSDSGGRVDNARETTFGRVSSPLSLPLSPSHLTFRLRDAHVVT